MRLAEQKELEQRTIEEFPDFLDVVSEFARSHTTTELSDHIQGHRMRAHKHYAAQEEKILQIIRSAREHILNDPKHYERLNLMGKVGTGVKVDYLATCIGLYLKDIPNENIVSILPEYRGRFL
jgi:hypothetical protein